MTNAPWPPDLPYQPMRQQLRFAPPRRKAVTEMDDGSLRQRQRFAAAPRFIPHGWVWTLDQFALFQFWYEETLLAGTAWFDGQFWNGEAYVEGAGRFADPDGYQATLKGASASVTARLEIEATGWTLTPEAAAIRWPDSFGS